MEALSNHPTGSECAVVDPSGLGHTGLHHRSAGRTSWGDCQILFML